jgi:hypothetical protein
MRIPQYIPRHFCKEYAQIKGCSVQIGMFMACVLGLKPLMDDWVPVNRLNEFKQMCKAYGLKTREDAIFVNVPKSQLPGSIIGRKYITTTSAFAFPVETKRDGQVHLFISKDEKMFTRIMWYPVIIKNRVIFQPRIDSLRFGYALGYPDCCIRFFRRYNLWDRYSYLYEAFKRTTQPASFLCNPFLKDSGFSYIYHMPCDFHCEDTLALSGAIRKAINAHEPEYVRLTDRYLKMHFLVLYEQKCYAFEGKVEDNVLRYQKVYSLFPRREQDKNIDDLTQADGLKLAGRKMSLFKNKRPWKVIEIPTASTAPVHPFLLKFS